MLHRVYEMHGRYKRRGPQNSARKKYFDMIGCVGSWRPAWINDLQQGMLENGVNRRSPGTPSVEPVLARLAEKALVFFIVEH